MSTRTKPPLHKALEYAATRPHATVQQISQRCKVPEHVAEEARRRIPHPRFLALLEREANHLGQLLEYRDREVADLNQQLSEMQERRDQATELLRVLIGDVDLGSFNGGYNSDFDLAKPENQDDVLHALERILAGLNYQDR